MLGISDFWPPWISLFGIKTFSGFMIGGLCAGYLAEKRSKRTE
jgi:hypothetical protein